MRTLDSREESRFVNAAIMMLVRPARVEIVERHYEPNRLTTTWEVTEEIGVATSPEIELVNEEAALEQMMDHCAKRLQTIRAVRR